MKNLRLKKNQSGLTTVEFAICGSVYFLVLFSIIEVGRFMFTLNVMDEITRRGARLASVCPVTSNTNVINTAILNGSILPELLPSHITINYLEGDLTVINDPVADFPDIIYVQVLISGYIHSLLIPMLPTDIPTPSFSTTVLAESLGVIPPTETTPYGYSSC